MQNSYFNFLSPVGFDLGGVSSALDRCDFSLVPCAALMHYLRLHEFAHRLS